MRTPQRHVRLHPPVRPRCAWLVSGLFLLVVGCTKAPGPSVAARPPVSASPSISAPPSAPALPSAGQTLMVFNWSEYIDPELVTEFERRTGAKVQYDNYSSSRPRC
jgi:spermidine/putrescine transport system substrate-binding protein